MTGKYPEDFHLFLTKWQLFLVKLAETISIGQIIHLIGGPGSHGMRAPEQS